MKALRPITTATLLLLAGLALTAALGHQVRKGIEHDTVVEFAAQADEAALRLRQQLWTYGVVLRGGAGFFNGAREVSREDWRNYVARLRIGEHLAGVQGLGFVELVPRAQLAAHEARVRAEGFPAYRVFPGGLRDPYTAIVYLEPFEGRNLRAFGFDMYAEPVRRAAMDQARDTGIGAMSGKVRLVQEDGKDEQAGFLLYFPVYRAGAPVRTLDQRRAALVGWTYSPYRMKDMMAAVFADWRDVFGRGLYMAVYDGGREQADALMFDNFPAGARRHLALQRRTVEFRGRQWLVLCGRRLAAADYTLAWLTVAGGVVASLLLAGLAFALARTRAEAQRLAHDMTLDLRDRERRLAESEARWKFALEGAGLGVWDWYVPGGRVFYSQRWKELLGHDAGELSGARDEWSARLHPDDSTAVTARLQDCLRGRTRLYASEHRLRCRDGSYKWVLERGMVVERDAQGQPLRMLGTLADIDDARNARLRAERLDRLYQALSGCNSAIVHCTTEQALFNRVCEVVVLYGGVKMAWIGRIDPATRRILPVASFGTGTEYLDGIEISVDAADEDGRGPSGIAVRENRPVWSPDYAHDPDTAPWQARGASYGWTASAALPLSHAGKVVGVFNIYVGEGGFFDQDTQALLLEMASDIGFALDKFAAELEAEYSRASLVESEQRFQAIIEQSIAGAYIIQDGRFVYVNPRFVEIMGGQSPADFVGRAPADFLQPGDRATVIENERRLLAGELLQAQSAYTAHRLDGSRVAISTYSSRARYRGRAAVIGLIQDVSDRKVAEAQIQRYASQLQRLLEQTVGLATTIGELRDPYTTGHEQRVAEIAEAIGREMGLAPDRLDGLRIGGYLHDVGKIHIPTEILSKPGRLSDSEYTLIKEHPRAGFEVLKDVEFPWPVAQMALQHHERLDGSGYPQGLKGDAILLEARILAVADVVESMSSHRPYRPGLGIDAALAEIEQGSGTRYDAEAVAACLRLFREKGFSLERRPPAAPVPSAAADAP